MPRDSTGAYSLPSGTLVNTGDTILVSQHNPAMQDVEQAIGNTLDRDGKGGMRAPLNMGGKPITNAANGVNPSDVATVGQLVTSPSVPIGAVIDYFGPAPPSGYLFPYGQAISRTTYADLFALIGTTQGAGDGSTTFNLPDYRGRVGAGKDDMGGTSAARLNTLSSTTLGASGGEQTHALMTPEMPSHTHALTDPGHSHSTLGSGIAAYAPGSGALTAAAATTGTSYANISIGSTGGGGAHNNVQPTIVVGKIMRVL